MGVGGTVEVGVGVGVEVSVGEGVSVGNGVRLGVSVEVGRIVRGCGMPPLHPTNAITTTTKNKQNTLILRNHSPKARILQTTRDTTRNRSRGRATGEI